MLQETKQVFKVFISYSWTTSDHEDWVIELAQRLESIGFHVILDKWNLIPGQDKYQFMETSVRALDIDKVLIILDKGYTEKANNRSGGVGTETQIISPGVYDAVDQQKFIPLVRELNEEGKPYIPVFLKGRIYLDFSDDSKFEEMLEELTMNIVNKPTHRRPVRGTLPGYLTDEETEERSYKTRFLVRGIDQTLTKRPERLESAVEDFLEEFFSALTDFTIKVTDRSLQAIGKQIIDSLNEYTPLRDDFIQFFYKITRSGQNFDADLLINFFGKLPQYTYPPANAGSFIEEQFDNYRFIIHELFLNLIALLLKTGSYKLIEELCYSKYRIQAGYSTAEPQTYGAFYHPISSIDTYYRKLKNQDYINPTSAFLYARASQIITAPILVEADLLCYYVSELRSVDSSDMFSYDDWFPVTYLYQSKNSFEFFRRIVSKRFFEKVKNIYDVDTPGQLSEKITRYRDKNQNSSRVAYSGSHEAVIPLHKLISPEAIATER